MNQKLINSLISFIGLFIFITPINLACHNGDNSTETEGTTFDSEETLTPTTNTEPVCGNDILEFGEECDDSTDELCVKCYEPRQMFVSSVAFNGFEIGQFNIGDVCKTLSTGVHFSHPNHFPKTWTAWISYDSDFVEERVFHSPGLYINAAAEIIAINWDDLVDGNLNYKIKVGPTSTDNQTLDVWTGTLIDGTVSEYNCNNWSSKDVSARGTYGNNFYTDDLWTDYSFVEEDRNSTCDSEKYVYCIESNIIPNDSDT